eukprot:763891-Hanusia_phi.AAC.8
MCIFATSSGESNTAGECFLKCEQIASRFLFRVERDEEDASRHQGCSGPDTVRDSLTLDGSHQIVGTLSTRTNGME